MHKDHGNFLGIVFVNLEEAGVFKIGIREKQSLDIDGTILPLAEEVGNRRRKIGGQSFFPSIENHAFCLEASVKCEPRSGFIKTNESRDRDAHTGLRRARLSGQTG